MDTVTLVIVIVVVVVVVAAIAVGVSVMLRKRRSDRLREEFGPEYERTMRESGDPRAAEDDLRRREKQRAKLQLRELDPRERDEYRDRWDSVQREFVDDPGRAVGKADRLVVDVMSARGYPAEDIDRRAEDLSVDFPVITQRYREAREISRSRDEGRADTEDLRNAVTSYRALVHALLDDGDGERGGDDRRELRGGTAPRDERDGGRYDERDAGRGRDTGLSRDADLDRDRDDRRDDVRDRGRDDVRDGGRYDERDDVRDGDAGRGPISDRGGRDRDDDRGRDVDGDRGRDGRGLGDVVRDKVSGRDRDAGSDRDGDRGRDGRGLGDVVRDKVTGRDRDAGPGRDADRDDRAADREPDDRHWERGRHVRRSSGTEDDPRREATT